jgi:hypothetical protein
MCGGDHRSRTLASPGERVASVTLTGSPTAPGSTIPPCAAISPPTKRLLLHLAAVEPHRFIAVGIGDPPTWIALHGVDRYPDQGSATDAVPADGVVDHRKARLEERCLQPLSLVETPLSTAAAEAADTDDGSWTANEDRCHCRRRVRQPPGQVGSVR